MRNSGTYRHRRALSRAALICFAAFSTACASTGSSGGSAPATAADGRSDPTASGASSRWAVSTAAHVDLWLHAFAMISTDTLRVPLYRRGYRDSISAVRLRSNVLTALDGNREKLAQGLATSPSYMQAQFLPFDFASWDEMRAAAEKFLQFEGEPRRAPDESSAARVAQFASVFPTATDRNWLRLFVTSVQDEQVRWFAGEHARVVASKASVIAAVDSLLRFYHPKFERFLNNTGQRNGLLMLSLPIGGEGRAGVGAQRHTIIATTLPGRTEDVAEAIYVFAHEITGSLTGNVVTDNTTPAQARDGSSERYVSAGQVRAGAMLLEKIAPELVVPYMRYYLAQSGSRALGDPSIQFARIFELPKAISDGLLRQIEIVLGGI